MILVTVGTAEPFDRLLRAVADLDGEEPIVVQYGVSTIRPERATCVSFMPFDELVALIRDARVVVTAAGVGTVMTVLAGGKRPIVVPRLKRHGEAVDDHQLAFARRVAEAGLVTIVEDESRLGAAVSDTATASAPPMLGENRLAADLRDYLLERIGRPNGTSAGLNDPHVAAGSDLPDHAVPPLSNRIELDGEFTAGALRAAPDQ